AVLTTTATHTGTRHVLVLCSTKNTQRIFQYVRERQLELPSLWWLMVGETDLSQTLQPLLWEGSLVTLAVRTSSTSYSIMISRVDSTGLPKFVPVGSWILTPSGPVVQVQEPLVPDPLKLYSDMSGRQLIVTANNNWPFFGLDKFRDGKVQKKTGIDIEIMNTLGQFLNFTRETVVDFTIPYYLETLILVSRAPAEKNRVFAVFSPFSVQ
ncbi:putative iGluR-like protein, partial [Homarus americanus]